MNARALGFVIAATAVLGVPLSGTCSTPAPPVSAPFAGGGVGSLQVTSLVGSGLQYRASARVGSFSPSTRYSDSRLKTDVRTLTDALATIQSLRAVTFRWNAAQIGGRTVPAGRQIGFIAQEAQRVLPEAVATDANGYLTVDYASVVPVLVEAIKEQQRQLDAKDATIEKVRSDADVAVRDLQTRLADVEDALTRLSTGNAGTANQGLYGGQSYYGSENPYGIQSPFTGQGGYRVLVPGVY